jgi:preprotein translocase subunit SecA
MPDRLARRLAATVRDAREHEARLAARRLSDAELAASFAALAVPARRDGLATVVGAALGHAALAATRLVGTAHRVCGDELVWQLRPRDNQLACAAVLARGDVAELDTGEGKTLCVAMAAACWSLAGRVHAVTANEYLARRDFEWMEPLLRALGVEVACVEHETEHAARQAAYDKAVVYVSIKEIGADYLRDTLTSERSALLLPALETAILDEIDFILVDEARIPLILAQQVDPTENLCHQFNEAVAAIVAEQEQVKARVHGEIDEVAGHDDWAPKKRAFESNVRLATLLLADPLDPRLERRFAGAADAGDGAVVRNVKGTIARFEKSKRLDELLDDLLFTVDHKAHAVQLTERGLDRLQSAFGDLFEPPRDDPEAIESHRSRLRAVHNLIAGHVLYRRDREYIVEDGRVVLVDQATGRPSFDRHLQHGLHRALEAKEGLYPALDHQTAAEITFPGLFQLYDRFCGTSGTCLELTAELAKGPKEARKDVVRVPPHRPSIRVDYEDALFLTVGEKADALVAEVLLSRRLRQPVLIGTSTVEQSEWVSGRLAAAGVDHQVLNARHHEREARIIARAGEPATVTVATTMAGRGTDIRPAPGLAAEIAAAVAEWAATDLGGVARFEVFSDIERELLVAALARAGLAPRLASHRRRTAVVDVGKRPPATAFPVCLGLRIVGFERLGASRLDRQLRGRTGRQGAPGATRFYLALDDETVLLHADRALVGELRRASRPLVDPLAGGAVRSGRRLLAEVSRAWATLESITERHRQRLNKLDLVDQAQRRHYDAERRALLFAPDDVVGRLADEALARAARDLAAGLGRGAEIVDLDLEPELDATCEVLFERGGLVSELFRQSAAPRVDDVAAALAAALARRYAVARAAHGAAMAQVERTVLLDALTEVWRTLAGERPDLREQADLYAYANREPDVVYRHLAGAAYHRALATAARTAASVLVTFPLPLEVKSPRTGTVVDADDVLAILGAHDERP